MRAHRLRARARGQRPPVRGLRAAQALPRARGPAGHAGGERDGRERQDLRRGPRGGQAQPGPGRRDDGPLRGRHVAARAGPARPRAEGGRHGRGDRGADRGPDRGRPRLRGGRRRVLPRRELPRLRQAVQPAAAGDAPGRGRRCRPAQGEPARLRAVEGAQGGRGHQAGPRRGARGGRAGTSSARPWPSSCWAPTSRSTAAARTWCSPTTRTRSRRPRPPAASRWPGSGCTTACSSWATAARRWPSRWATSTCCTPRWTSTAATR